MEAYLLYLYIIFNLEMIGINGLGRIGRLVLRASFENPKGLDVTCVNDPFMKPKDLRYLLTYDSAHLRFPFSVEEWEHGVTVNGKKIRLYSEVDPAKIPWAENGVVTVC